jgi:hypothetical protein
VNDKGLPLRLTNADSLLPLIGECWPCGYHVTLKSYTVCDWLYYDGLHLDEAIGDGLQMLWNHIWAIFGFEGHGLLTLMSQPWYLQLREDSIV